jgi:epoxyqueuosine reductase
VGSAASRAVSVLAADVRRAGVEAGLDAVGIAEARPFTGTRRHLEERKAEGLDGGLQFTYRNPPRATDPGRLVPGAAALVVGAMRYLRDESEGDAGDPPRPSAAGPSARVARYAWRDHYAVLRQALEQVGDVLRAEGFVARVVADDNGLVDREAAYRAGLGWYGKNTNLLLPGLGSWFILGSVVTDAPLPFSEGPVADGCGSCTRCLTACPTGAFIRPGVLDARRCLAALVQLPGVFPMAHRIALGDRLYGCDECQEVCPVNQRAERSWPASPAQPSDQSSIDLLGLLSASDDELLAAVGRWYIPQRNPRYVRRNALVALGNAGDPSDPGVTGAVREALTATDPLVRAHAVWAAARLGRRDLLALVAGDPDPMVREELEAAAAVPARSGT